MTRIKLGVVMDPIASIQPKKDSTLAMLLEAQKRGWQIFEMHLNDLHALEGIPYATMRELKVYNDLTQWYEYTDEISAPLSDLDVILMRKDPPFNMEFVYTTYLLDRAADLGTLVFNRPQSLRDANEKLFTMWFPQCTPVTLVTREAKEIKKFLAEHKAAVIKPPDGMGGHSIFFVKENDPNTNVVIETLTQRGTRFAIVQKFVPEAKLGDKRILLIDGEPFPYAVARVPPPDDFRGNLAVGAQGKGVELTERDRWLCSQVGPVLREKGMLFVGIDVLGDYLTEINVTSPTGIREIDKAFGVSVCETLFDTIQTKLDAR
ncbi:MAG: glutathione synthase [Deltaproteobacteria bacterium]|nr:MAG: glutathione synthase [Deltaproteobacteria bacterium]